MESDVIEIKQGVPFIADLEFLDDSINPPVPIDISTLTVFISVKKLTDTSFNDLFAVITSKITLHSFPLIGKTTWILTKSETLIPIGRYKADVKLLTDANVFINSDIFYIDIVPIVTQRIV